MKKDGIQTRQRKSQQATGKSIRNSSNKKETKQVKAKYSNSLSSLACSNLKTSAESFSSASVCAPLSDSWSLCYPRFSYQTAHFPSANENLPISEKPVESLQALNSGLQLQVPEDLTNFHSQLQFIPQFLQSSRNQLGLFGSESGLLDPVSTSAEILAHIENACDPSSIKTSYPLQNII